MLFLQELTAQINEKSYATVPFALKRTDFEAAIDQFVRFLALPSEVKESAYLHVPLSDERGADVGYQRRMRKGTGMQGAPDNREFFHYHPVAEEHFREIADTHAELRGLLDAARHIHQNAKQAVSEILQTLDQAHPGLHARFFIPGEEPNFHLRLLKYDRMHAGEFLAIGHYDRGGCTLALAESAPGLRIGIDDQHLQEVDHADGQAIFMPALNFPLFTDGAFRPAWHDVVQKSEDVYSEDIARWAIVFFVDTYIKPNTTWEDRHAPQRI